MSLSVSPFQAAVERMSSRTPVAVALRSDEWEDAPQELRDRAFWTANFAQADVLQLMHDQIGKGLSLASEQMAGGSRLVNRSTFIRTMKDALQKSGYLSEPGEEGTIKDHSSRGRLGLIWDINTQMAHEYGDWKVGQDPAILEAFPAQELYREQSRHVPRRWRAIWGSHRGGEYRGRMIARKNDPIWTAISRFGNPYPPFDYNSGMGIRDVSRRDAEALGVIKPGEKITPAHKGFNDTLSLSATNLTPALIDRLKAQFGDQVVFEHNRAQWQANLIPDFVEHVSKNRTWNGTISLGMATRKTVDAAAPYADIEGYELVLTASEARHAMDRHGVGNESDASQVGLTPRDFLSIPELWRNPDSVGRGNQKKVPDSLIFKKDLDGIVRMVTWRMIPTSKKIYLHSLLKKMEGPHE